MTGLINRLRKGAQLPLFDLRQDAADRIEELEAEIKRLKRPLPTIDNETGKPIRPDSTITQRVADVMALMNRAESAEADWQAAEAKLREARSILEDAPEINPSNYDHEQVCELNAKMVEAYLFLERGARECT